MSLIRTGPLVVDIAAKYDSYRKYNFRKEHMVAIRYDLGSLDEKYLRDKSPLESITKYAGMRTNHFAEKLTIFGA